MKRLKCGKIIRKLNTGGVIDYSQYAEPVANIVDALGSKGGYAGVGSSALSYGLRGAAAGAALGPIGAAVGGGVGALVGGVTSYFNREKYMTQQQREKDFQKSERRRIGKNTVDIYPVHGSSTGNYYARGGIMPNGGTLVPLNRKTEIAVGRTHEQGGIEMGNIEVEDQEVRTRMPGYDVWFSNRIGFDGKTFAEHAKSIASHYNDNEQKGKTGSVYSRGTAKRNMEKLDTVVTAMAGFQEQVNGRPNRIAADGAIVPFLDNAANAIITANYPRVPQLERNVAYDLPTKYNTQAQIDSIESQVQGAERGIERTTSNSAALRANKVGLRTQAINSLNSVLQQKANIELELQARNAQNKQAVTNTNIGITNQQKMLEYDRSRGIASAISDNAANAVEDVRVNQQMENQKAKDAAEIEILKNYYNTNGIYDRAVSDDLQQLINGQITVAEFRKRMSAKNLPLPSSNAPGTQITNNANGLGDLDTETVTNFMYSRVRG